MVKPPDFMLINEEVLPEYSEECSATFFATYSQGSECKGESGSQLIRED